MSAAIAPRGERVVVGEEKRIDACLAGGIDQFGDAEAAVGVRAVRVNDTGDVVQ